MAAAAPRLMAQTVRIDGSRDCISSTGTGVDEAVAADGDKGSMQRSMRRTNSDSLKTTPPLRFPTARPSWARFGDTKRVMPVPTSRNRRDGVSVTGVVFTLHSRRLAGACRENEYRVVHWILPFTWFPRASVRCRHTGIDLQSVGGAIVPSIIRSIHPVKCVLFCLSLAMIIQGTCDSECEETPKKMRPAASRSDRGRTW